MAIFFSGRTYGSSTNEVAAGVGAVVELDHDTAGAVIVDVGLKKNIFFGVERPGQSQGMQEYIHSCPEMNGEIRWPICTYGLYIVMAYIARAQG